MVSTTFAAVVAVLALIIGAIAGVLLWRSFGPHRDGRRDLEKRLEDAERRLGDYQSEVTEHFVETSRRVNELTRNYRDVHEYLASSAVKLTSPSLGREMRAAAQVSWSDTEQASAKTNAETDGEEEARADQDSPAKPGTNNGR